MILLIEDNELVAKSLIRILSKRGITVDHASTLAEASAFITTKKYILTITDRDLPDGNGWMFVFEHMSCSTKHVIRMSGNVPDNIVNRDRVWHKGQDSIQKLIDMVVETYV